MSKLNRRVTWIGSKPAEVRCVLACINANGEPDFAFVNVWCSSDQYDDGEHYEAAKAWAKDNYYGGPFVVFDEIDGPDFLFDHFVWKSASIINTPYGSKDQ